MLTGPDSETQERFPSWFNLLPVEIILELVGGYLENPKVMPQSDATVGRFWLFLERVDAGGTH